MGSRLITVRSQKVCDDGSSFLVLLDGWPSDKVVRWDHLATYVNATSALVQLLAKRGNVEYLLKAETVSAQTKQVFFTGPVWLPGDFRLGVKITTLATGSVVEVAAFGEVEG